MNIKWIHTHTRAHLYYVFIAIFLAIIASHSLLTINISCVSVSEWMSGMFWNKIKLVANSSERSHQDRNNWLRATIFHIIKWSSLNMVLLWSPISHWNWRFAPSLHGPSLHIFISRLIWIYHHWIGIVKVDTHPCMQNSLLTFPQVCYDCNVFKLKNINKKSRIIGNDYQ